MPDIPSIGISAFDTTDPSMVNVEAQAYPRPTDLAQSLARTLNFLASTFQPNPPPPPLATGPRPSEVFAANQPFVPLPLSLGTVDANDVNIDITVQNVIRQPIAEFIVTESGNFAVNPSVPDTVSRTSTVVTSFVDQLTLLTYFVITFGPTVNLMDFGIDLAGTQAAFPSSAPPLNPGAVPAALVTKFTNRQIVVVGTNLLAIPPVAGNVVILDVSRHGPENIFDLFSTEVEVTPAPNLQGVVVTVADSRQVIDAFASDGVRVPFIGAGARIPLLLFQDLRETAFFPSDRPIRTLGLPINVNVG